MLLGLAYGLAISVIALHLDAWDYSKQSIGVLAALYAGGIILRDAYDMAWGPIAAGAVAAIALFFVSESDRRLQLG